MARIRNTLVALLGAVLVFNGRALAASGLCDVNQDAITNIVDVKIMIDETLHVRAATDDLNGDGVVNVVDVQIELLAALGSVCLAGPQSYSIVGTPVSIENTFSPAQTGARTLVASSAPVSVENSISPLLLGPQTLVASSAPVSVENTFSPAQTGPQTLVVSGAPVSIENLVSPAPTGPQTYYTSGLPFSIFNGILPSSLLSALSPSLRFLVPVNPTFLAEALARGAERIDGKPVCQDSDGDGICDADELIIGTSPFLSDTDGDGYPDGLELALGSDPLDPKSIPDIRPPGYFATPPVSVQSIVPVAILTPNRQGAIYAAYIQ